jgi:hypothetical protein
MISGNLWGLYSGLYGLALALAISSRITSKLVWGLGEPLFDYLQSQNVYYPKIKIYRLTTIGKCHLSLLFGIIVTICIEENGEG